MQKTKKTLIAFVGLIALTAFIASSSTATSKDGATTADVNVVNSPVVQAQQSGSWNVGLAGSPTVQVGNLATNPVLIRDVDRPTAQPFQQNIDVTTPLQGFGDATGNITVPQGKLMVIEQVSGRLHVPEGQTPEVSIQNTLAPVTEMSFHYLSAARQEGAPNTRMYVKSQQVRIYLDGPSAIRLIRQGDPYGDLSARFVISGYLVDK